MERKICSFEAALNLSLRYSSETHSQVEFGYMLRSSERQDRKPANPLRPSGDAIAMSDSEMYRLAV